MGFESNTKRGATSSEKDPLAGKDHRDAAQVPPSVLQKEIGGVHMMGEEGEHHHHHKGKGMFGHGHK